MLAQGVTLPCHFYDSDNQVDKGFKRQALLLKRALT